MVLFSYLINIFSNGTIQLVLFSNGIYQLVLFFKWESQLVLFCYMATSYEKKV